LIVRIGVRGARAGDPRAAAHSTEVIPAPQPRAAALGAPDEQLAPAAAPAPATPAVTATATTTTTTTKTGLRARVRRPGVAHPSTGIERERIARGWPIDPFAEAAARKGGK